MPAATVPPHPCIPPWLRPLTRRRGEIQFGVLPGGPVVTGVTDAEAALLGRLDGSLPLASTDRLAADSGIGHGRWRALLELTTRLGVLMDRSAGDACTAPAPGHRVVIDGSGDLASRLAEALGQTGLTVVHGRVAVDRAVAAPHHPRPDLVVLVGSPVVDPRRGDVWLRQGVAHLPVAPARPRTLVGPLVDGTPGAPCLWCLDRHRTDRDDAWPTVMSQAAPGRALLPAALPEDVHDLLAPGVAHIVVGSVALLVSGVIAGHSPPPGVSVEVSLPWPRMDHRRWPTHPLCPGHPKEAGAPAGQSAISDADRPLTDALRRGA